MEKVPCPLNNKEPAKDSVVAKNATVHFRCVFNEDENLSKTIR